MLNSIMDTQSGKDERIIWCENNLLANGNKRLVYEIKENRLIIYGDVIIPADIKKIEVKIDELYGDICTANSIDNTPGLLESFINFPDIVHGSINVSCNKQLTSFKGCPKTVDGYFKCNACGFTSTDDISEHIGGVLKLYNNPITNIDRLTEIYIGRMIDIDFIKVKPTNESFKKLLKQHKIEVYDFSWN